MARQATARKTAKKAASRRRASKPVVVDFHAHIAVHNIMMGTDYPFGERDPLKFVRSAKKISRKDQDAILGANAAKFLGIKA